MVYGDERKEFVWVLVNGLLEVEFENMVIVKCFSDNILMSREVIIRWNVLIVVFVG